MRRCFPVLALALLVGCAGPQHDPRLPETQVYGTLDNGQTATLYTLTNASGAVAQLTDYGAILVSLKVPDRDGNLADVTLGYDTLEGWVNDGHNMGATVGRFGNRIALGRFTLEGNEYALATNNGPNHLHGGDVGFNRYVWDAEIVEAKGATGVRFTHVSPDGDEGYPGTLTASATYWLTDDNALKIVMDARTDAPTVVNLVHHTYWNLAGVPGSTIDDHVLTIPADAYLPVDETIIPLPDAPQPVAGTPFDFTTPRRIGDRVEADDVQIERGNGYDHAYVLNDTSDDPDKLHHAATVVDPASGRVMELWTNQPAVQLYTGNYLGGEGKGGVPIPGRGALCLETEVHPDAPNRDDFPSAVLRPGELYRHVMVHKFYAE